MKKWIRILLFILSFQLEIRVKAARPLLWPELCLEKKGPCALQTEERGQKVKIGAIEYRLGPETLFLRDPEGIYSFAQGILHVSFEERGMLRFVHGQIETVSAGKFLLEESDHKIWIYNETADLWLTLRSRQRVFIPAGYMIWVGGLKTDKTQDYGVPTAWDLQVYLKKLRNMPWSKSELMSYGVQLKEIAKIAQSNNALLYQTVINRQIASAEEEQRQQARRLQIQKEKRARMQQLFYQRTFER